MASICCRLCLLNCSDLLPIRKLTVNSNGANAPPVTPALSQLIDSYLSIEPANEGTIDTYICTGCRNAIADWHWFREACLQNDSVYLEMVQDLETNGDHFEVEVKQEIEMVLDSEESGDEDAGAVEVKQEIEVGEREFSENILAEPEEEVKQEKEVELELEDMLIEPIDPSPNEKLDGPKKLLIQKRLPVKKKLGRPRLLQGRKIPIPQICQLCGKLVKGLTAHMKMHTKERIHQCPHCPKNFYIKSNFEIHVNIHTKEKKFTCSVCDKVFYRSDSLKQHLMSHTKERNIKCPYCPKTYGTRAGIIKHRKTHSHIQTPEIECVGCERMFYTKYQMYEHAVVHMTTKPGKKSSESPEDDGGR